MGRIVDRLLSALLKDGGGRRVGNCRGKCEDDTEMSVEEEEEQEVVKNEVEEKEYEEEEYEKDGSKSVEFECSLKPHSRTLMDFIST